MKIAVITPYYKESIEVLKKCHDSVVAQKADVDHFMIADGFPLAEIDQWKVRHVKLPNAHGDNGNTPRAIGGLLAQSGGYDFVAYLDADNWFHPDHLASLIEMYSKTKASVLSSFRSIHTLEGEDMGISETQELKLEHVDTSCLMLHRNAFELLPLWANMNKALGPICDRIFFATIKHRRFNIRSTGKKTVAFRSQYAAHYKIAKINIPEGMKTGDEFRGSYNYLRSIDGIQNCIRDLGFWPLPYILKSA